MAQLIWNGLLNLLKVSEMIKIVVFFFNYYDGGIQLVCLLKVRGVL